MRAALLFTVAVLASACATENHPAATSTPSVEPPPTGSSTNVPAPPVTPVPLLAWDIPPKTGIAGLDAFIAAMTTSDVAALESFIERGLQTSPCETIAAPDARSCAPGVPVGTPAQFVTFVAGCHGGVVRVDRGQPLSGGTTVRALAESLARPTTSLSFVVQRNAQPPSHNLVFFNARDGSTEAGWMLAVTGDAAFSLRKLESAARLCNPGTLSEVVAQARANSTLLIPPPP